MKKEERRQACIAARLDALRARISALEGKALAAKAVTLIAVSKTQRVEAIAEAIDAGHAVFGENRVQEAVEKWPGLRAAHPDTELHLIGPLQTNKVKEALRLFDVIQTVDRPALIDAIVKERSKHAVRCNGFFLQVNTGEKPQKAGIAPQEVMRLADYALAGGLKLKGLMCVPPVHENPAPHFALLRTLALQLAVPYLSMGMSGDFETAIRMGATHIRVGSALFGERAV